MGARIEAPPIGRLHPGGGVIVAVVVALVVGGIAGSLVTRVIDRTEPDFTTAATWDAGKLEAMEGRQLAAAVAAERATAGSTLWDSGKLQALKGLQRAAALAAAEAPSAETHGLTPLERHRLTAKFK